MRSVAATLAGAFDSAVRREGFVPDPALRLVADGIDRAAGIIVGDPHDLGPLHEQLVGGAERTRRGAWYTPRWLAEDLVRRAVDTDGTVVDPSCGGGVFLLAAADHLVAGGLDPAAALGRLWGCDVDPLAVAVCEAALWWWSARSGCPTRLGESLVVGDALTEVALPPAGSVVGNPPFLGQLRSSTTVDADRRAALRARFGDAVRAYTDPAWLFALAAVEQAAPGGHVALVQPQSFLAARDAAAVRDRIDACADLVHTVVDDGGAFAAKVQVCAPVLRRRLDGAVAGTNDWVAPLADAAGIPSVVLTSPRCLDALATVHAGFRDEYYGLVDVVSESGSESDGGEVRPRLVTAGGIDPCRLLDRGQRFAGKRWTAPVVHTSSLQGRTARWAAVQAGPKLLVATQTRVLEAVADPDGSLLGSVPVLCVRPHDADALWHLLAALHAPAATAWLFRRSAGTALSADACRPTVALISALPVPEDGPAWDLAAEAARAASVGDADVTEVARLADAALGVDDPDLLAWWDARRPRR